MAISGMTGNAALGRINSGPSAEELAGTSLHQHTRAALEGLSAKITLPGDTNGNLVDALYVEHWYEGITSESGARINEWLDKLLEHVIKGTVTVTPETRELLTNWQRGLETRQENLTLRHAYSQSVAEKLSIINAIGDFMSPETPVTSDTQSKMEAAIERRGASVHESYRFATNVLKNQHISAEKRNALMDAALTPHVTRTRGQFSDTVSHEVPRSLEEALPDPQDRDALFAYAARRDREPWDPMREMLANRCKSDWAGTKSIIVKAILDAKGSGKSVHDFEGTIASLKLISGRIGADEMADLLREVLSQGTDRDDEWLSRLLIYISRSPASNKGDPDAPFKAHMESALEQLSTWKSEDETLTTALFRFALNANLVNSAKMLCTKATDELELSDCLNLCMNKADLSSANKLEPALLKLMNAIVSRMDKEDRGETVGPIEEKIKKRRLAANQDYGIVSREIIKDEAKLKAKTPAASKPDDESKKAQVENDRKKLKADIAGMKEGRQLLIAYLEKLDLIEEAVANPGNQSNTASTSASSLPPVS